MKTPSVRDRGAGPISHLGKTGKGPEQREAKKVENKKAPVTWRKKPGNH